MVMVEWQPVLPPFKSLPQSQDGPSSLVPAPWPWSCEDPSLVPENHFLEMERHKAESPLCLWALKSELCFYQGVTLSSLTTLTSPLRQAGKTVTWQRSESADWFQKPPTSALRGMGEEGIFFFYINNPNWRSSVRYYLRDPLINPFIFLMRARKPREPVRLTHIPHQQQEWCWSLSHAQLLATPWSVAHQAPLSVEFFRQEYWSGQLFSSPWDIPDPGIKSGLLHCRQILY